MIPVLFIMACAALIGVGAQKAPEPRAHKTIIVEKCATYRTQKVCRPEYRGVE